MALAKVKPAARLMHGKVSAVHHNGEGVFAGLDEPFAATRYHSLTVPQKSLPECLERTAWTEDPDYPDEVMGVRHREYPIYGVQFHPESFLTKSGVKLLTNFLRISPELRGE